MGALIIMGFRRSSSIVYGRYPPITLAGHLQIRPGAYARRVNFTQDAGVGIVSVEWIDFRMFPPSLC